MAGLYPNNQELEIFGEPVVWPGVNAEGKFTNGDFSNPLVPPSYIPAETINLILDNLNSLIIGAGLTPNNTDQNQLLLGINAFFNKFVPIGNVIIWPCSVALDGWMFCDASAISRSDYSILYSRIGTTWGAGNGSTTFNIPDFREASPYGAGSRSSGVTTHDVKNVGIFADDRIENHSHPMPRNTGSNNEQEAWNISRLAGGFAFGLDNFYSNPYGYEYTNGARFGETTRGKIVGTNFIIRVI